jgi:hypothetical protein
MHDSAPTVRPDYSEIIHLKVQPVMARMAERVCLRWFKQDYNAIWMDAAFNEAKEADAIPPRTPEEQHRGRSRIEKENVNVKKYHRQ